jgi:four helix bundle protein
MNNISQNTLTAISNFTQLDAWKEGHALVLMLYKMVKHFPREELFALNPQLRRAAVSITSNIAEGFSRQSYREKVQFYYISLGSITEIQNQLFIAKDLGYVTSEEFEHIFNQATKVQRILHGLIKSSKNKYVAHS